MYTGWGSLRERNHLKEPGVGGRIILTWIFRKWHGGGGAGTGFIRLGIGTGDEHLYMRS